MKNKILDNLSAACRVAVAATMGLTLGLAHADRVHADSEKLAVFTTIPDWASLAAEIGGDEVETSSMVFGREDPHFSEARPSFVKKLSQADVFISTGLEMEVGYLGPMLTNARNPRVMFGQPGNLVAASAVTPLRPQGNIVITRAMGDIHAAGNPHFNLDPLSGLAVARLIRDRFSQLRPAKADYFAERYTRFEQRMGEELVGKALNDKYNGAKLAELTRSGRLESFLKSQGDFELLAGWLGQMAPYRGTKVVDDHPMWQYFAQIMGIEVVGNLERVPGVQPSTSHMKMIIDMMRAQDIDILIKSPYYDPRFSRFVQEETGATLVELAHQVGSMEGADDYISMMDVNVRNLSAALSAKD